MERKWKRKSRKLAREMFWEKHDRETYECPGCGRQEEELLDTFEVHHKDGQPMDNRPENHVALCRPCHNLREGKKSSIEEIQNLRDSLDEGQQGEEEDVFADSVNRIYTAGSMHYHNDEDSTWRASVQGLEPTPAEIVSPKDVTYDHGGDLVAGVAGKDLVVACGFCNGGTPATGPSDNEIKQMLETVDWMNSDNDQIPVSELMDE